VVPEAAGLLLAAKRPTANNKQTNSIQDFPSKDHREKYYKTGTGMSLRGETSLIRKGKTRTETQNKT
jgi:hypothetical protein